MAQLRFDGRVAVITGSGGGLGLSHARLLAERGAAVVINDVGRGPGEEDAAQSAVNEIVAAGGSAVADRNSVATEDGAAALVQTALDTFGRIDIVINNAGILRDSTILKMDAATFDAVIAVHLRGSFLVTKAAWAHLREQKYGRIVNTTSPAGLYGNFGQANYASAKAGLVGLTRTLGAEGAKYGITANAISPAAATRMTEGLMEQLFGPLGSEILSPAKVSPVVGWLCHDSCSANGEIFGVAGGLVTRVVISETAGVFDPELTVESVAAAFDSLRSELPSIEPRNVPDSIAPLMARLKKEVGRVE